MGSVGPPPDVKDYYTGQRLSYDGALCTVRYCGALQRTKGEWLGVEWDDGRRGKHDGTHQGQRYFSCVSQSPKAGSFIRPSRLPDRPRTFLDALRSKYADVETVPWRLTGDSQETEVSKRDNAIEISGKVVEEVGFERIRKEQSVLQNLRIVLLDGFRVRSIRLEARIPTEAVIAREEIRETCPAIVELDLGWNLLETLTDVAEICLPLEKLRILKLSALHLRVEHLDLPIELKDLVPFRHVSELHLNETVLRPAEILRLLGAASGRPRFPELKTLSLNSNQLQTFASVEDTRYPSKLPPVTTLLLENNDFQDLSSLPATVRLFPDLSSISLQGNKISSINIPTDAHQQIQSMPKITTLNLSQNEISNYHSIEILPRHFPALHSLRVSHNPFFDPPTSRAPTSQTNTAFSLTLARIPTLHTLNHSTITPRDREEGELYYLSVTEREISAALSRGESREALQQNYTRYTALCALHDRPSILSSPPSTAATTSSYSAIPPNTLGARLIRTHFYIASNSRPGPSATLTRQIPSSTRVYALKALLARHFALPPLHFRCVYESEELDPVREDRFGSKKMEDWANWGDWDLDVDLDGSANGGAGRNKEGKWGADGMMMRDGTRWKKRETEIRDGTRAWGDYLESVEELGGREVVVRIELME